MIGSPSPNGRLEDQDRDQLVGLARRLLVEANALSSRISAVNEIGVAINRTLDLNAIEKVIAKQAKWLLDFDHCSVCLNDGVGTTWKLTTLFGAAEDNTLVPLDTENIGGVLKDSRPRLILDGSPSALLCAYASQMIIPLVADDQLMGTINFAAIKTRAYTQDDMRIGYMLALQLSSAIRNARTFEELKRARDELRNRANELEARNQELDAFSHTIAHDLKSPLNSMIMKSEIAMIRYADASANILDSFATIKERGEKMNEMIEQLLWLARLRNIRESVMPFDAGDVADAAASRFKPMLDEKKVKLDVVLPMPRVLGHAQWVEEVFANLISNAIKYMGTENPAPRITVRGCIVDNMVRFEVEDTGVGIAEKDQAKLFEMFTRLHTVQAEGLGLGLSIVHRIVTKLSGKVGVVSELGKGSTFWFTLPASDALARALSAAGD